jgi:DNA-binding winged helix-turn-helix (wHTH) protein
MEDDTYRFGDFSMTSREQRLFRNGKSVLLPPKAFDAVGPVVTTVPGKS